MISRKRITLQLTPLLDLLLIVMFSQHLEYRHLAASQKQTLQSQQQQLADQRNDLARQYRDIAQTLGNFLSPSQNKELGRQLENFPEIQNALTSRINSSPDAPLRFVNHVYGMPPFARRGWTDRHDVSSSVRSDTRPAGSAGGVE